MKQYNFYTYLIKQRKTNTSFCYYVFTNCNELIWYIYVIHIKSMETIKTKGYVDFYLSHIVHKYRDKKIMNA